MEHRHLDIKSDEWSVAVVHSIWERGLEEDISYTNWGPSYVLVFYEETCQDWLFFSLREHFSEVKTRGGKGSHRNLIHPKGVALTVSGKLGDDAKHYQEKEVVKKIKESQK